MDSFTVRVEFVEKKGKKEKLSRERSLLASSLFSSASVPVSQRDTPLKETAYTSMMNHSRGGGVVGGGGCPCGRRVGALVVANDQFSDCNGSHFKFTAVRE